MDIRISLTPLGALKSVPKDVAYIDTHETLRYRLAISLRNELKLWWIEKGRKTKNSANIGNSRNVNRLSRNTNPRQPSGRLSNSFVFVALGECDDSILDKALYSRVHSAELALNMKLLRWLGQVIPRNTECLLRCTLFSASGGSWKKEEGD